MKVFFYNGESGPVKIRTCTAVVNWYICLTLKLKYQMNQGTVKFFNPEKGFGFIKDIETGQDYFVHVSGLVDEIRENDEVTYDLQEGRKGMNAVNVKLL